MFSIKSVYCVLYIVGQMPCYLEILLKTAALTYKGTARDTFSETFRLAEYEIAHYTMIF